MNDGSSRDAPSGAKYISTASGGKVVENVAACASFAGLKNASATRNRSTSNTAFACACVTRPPPLFNPRIRLRALVLRRNIDHACQPKIRLLGFWAVADLM